MCALHPIFFGIANKLALYTGDIAQQPPNLPDERAQVVINHYLHYIDNFLAVTAASAPESPCATGL